MEWSCALWEDFYGKSFGNDSSSAQAHVYSPQYYPRKDLIGYLYLGRKSNLKTSVPIQLILAKEPNVVYLECFEVKYETPLTNLLICVCKKVSRFSNLNYPQGSVFCISYKEVLDGVANDLLLADFVLKTGKDGLISIWDRF